MTRVGLGCVNLGSGAGGRTIDDVALVHAALELGVTTFDTADVYGNGASEHVLGRALRGRRDEVVIATKGGFVFRERRRVEQWGRRRAKHALGTVRSRLERSTAPRGSSFGSGGGSYSQRDLSPGHLRRAVHESLRRLRTDRIDVYQLHAPEEVVPELFDQLADLVVVGDVVRFGVGASSVASADRWLGVDGLGLVQVPFGVLDPEAAATTLPIARRDGLEVWVRGVLGGGVLGLASSDPAALANHPKRARVEALELLARQSGVDLFQLALGFVRAKADEVSTVLVGTSSVAHLRDSVDALAAPALPADVVQALADLGSDEPEVR